MLEERRCWKRRKRNGREEVEQWRGIGRSLFPFKARENASCLLPWATGPTARRYIALVYLGLAHRVFFGNDQEAGRSSRLSWIDLQSIQNLFGGICNRSKNADLGCPHHGPLVEGLHNFRGGGGNLAGTILSCRWPPGKKRALTAGKQDVGHAGISSLHKPVLIPSSFCYQQ